MVKAVVQNGVIVPRGPLPDDWREGTEVEVQRAAEDNRFENGAHPTDVWMDDVEAIAAQGDPQDDARLDAAIQEIRHHEKHLARKKLGLDPEIEEDKAADPVESGDRLDRWFAELEAIAAEGDPDDDRRLHEAIHAIRRPKELTENSL